MESLQKLEIVLDDIFEKKAPPLPNEARQWIANALWWLTLIFGVLQLWSAIAFWQLGHTVDRWVDHANRIALTYGDGTVTATQHLGPMYYVSLLVLLADAALMLLAVPALKIFKKQNGWDLLYYGLLLNAAYGLVRAFSDVGSGVSSFVGSLIGSAIGAYFLFQVRSYFNGQRHASAKIDSKPTATGTTAAQKPTSKATK